VHAAYGATRVLHGIDFTMPERSITTLLGANGAGKTTTLRALCAMVKTAGEVSFDGKRIDARATEDIVRLGIAHVPDGRGTFANFSTEENLRLGAYTRKDRGAVGSDLERIYAYFPRLKERRAQQAGTLSGGEQQMLALAKAMLPEPRLLLVDELSLGLAPVIVSQLLDRLRSLVASGVSVVVVEQHVDLALEIADRAYFMERGQVRFDGLAADLRGRDDLLRSVFLAPVTR